MFDKLSSYLHALQQTITLVVTMLDQLSVQFQALQQTSTQPTSALNYSKLQILETTANISLAVTTSDKLCTEFQANNLEIYHSETDWYNSIF